MSKFLLAAGALAAAAAFAFLGSDDPNPEGPPQAPPDVDVIEPFALPGQPPDSGPVRFTIQVQSWRWGPAGVVQLRDKVELLPDPATPRYEGVGAGLIWTLTAFNSRHWALDARANIGIIDTDNMRGSWKFEDNDQYNPNGVNTLRNTAGGLPPVTFTKN